MYKEKQFIDTSTAVFESYKGSVMPVLKAFQLYWP